MLSVIETAPAACVAELVSGLPTGALAEHSDTPAPGGPTNYRVAGRHALSSWCLSIHAPPLKSSGARRQELDTALPGPALPRPRLVETNIERESQTNHMFSCTRIISKSFTSRITGRSSDRVTKPLYRLSPGRRSYRPSPCTPGRLRLPPPPRTGRQPPPPRSRLWPCRWRGRGARYRRLSGPRLFLVAFFPDCVVFFCKRVWQWTPT